MQESQTRNWAALRITGELLTDLVGKVEGDLGEAVESALISWGFPSDLKVVRWRHCWDRDGDVEFIISQRDLRPIPVGGLVPQITARLVTEDGVGRFDGWIYLGAP